MRLIFKDKSFRFESRQFKGVRDNFDHARHPRA